MELSILSVRNDRRKEEEEKNAIIILIFFSSSLHVLFVSYLIKSTVSIFRQ